MRRLKALYADTRAWITLRPVETCIIVCLVTVFAIGAFAGRVF